MYILEAKNLEKRFSLEAGFFARKDKFVYAVNDVSFGIERGKTYGLVGESGCGKSTTARLLIGMYKKDAGEILYTDPNGTLEADPSRALSKLRSGDLVETSGTVTPVPVDISTFDKKQQKIYREKVKYIFQDPGRSLNPRMTIAEVLTSSYKYSKSFPGKKEAREEAAAIMEEVGLSPDDLFRRPSEFSGGQRQRISIARGLIQKPNLLICDEVVSALDVSVQAQILNLLSDIREKRGLSFLFIAHDLKVACYFCDKIGVMYRGVLVEESDAADLYKDALHPYTKLLFETSQLLNTTADGNPSTGLSKLRSDDLVESSGTAKSSDKEIKLLTENLIGCPFAHRCPNCTEKCKKELPPWKEAAPNHKVRCWL